MRMTHELHGLKTRVACLSICQDNDISGNLYFINVVKIICRALLIPLRLLDLCKMIYIASVYIILLLPLLTKRCSVWDII